MARLRLLRRDGQEMILVENDNTGEKHLLNVKDTSITDIVDLLRRDKRDIPVLKPAPARQPEHMESVSEFIAEHGVTKPDTRTKRERELQDVVDKLGLIKGIEL